MLLLINWEMSLHDTFDKLGNEFAEGYLKLTSHDSAFL